MSKFRVFVNFSVDTSVVIEAENEDTAEAFVDCNDEVLDAIKEEVELWLEDCYCYTIVGVKNIDCIEPDTEPDFISDIVIDEDEEEEE